MLDVVWFGMLLEQLDNRNVVILVKYITLRWALSGVLANQISISKLPLCTLNICRLTQDEPLGLNLELM